MYLEANVTDYNNHLHLIVSTWKKKGGLLRWFVLFLIAKLLQNLFATILTFVMLAAIAKKYLQRFGYNCFAMVVNGCYDCYVWINL